MVGVRRPHFRVAVGLVGLLGSCSGGPSDVALEDCPGNTVNLSVSVGLAPTISWTPACGMSSLDVFPAAGGASLWVLYSGAHAAENPLRSGIVYAHAPPDALQVSGPVPLIPGTEYTVAVYRYIDGTRLQAGVATFRP
jgi:hypothetical protein